MADSYRTVTTKLRGLSRDAVLVERPRADSFVWIPRSLIHGADESKFAGMFIGEETTFRLMEWKAEEVGWA